MQGPMLAFLTLEHFVEGLTEPRSRLAVAGGPKLVVGAGREELRLALDFRDALDCRDGGIRQWHDVRKAILRPLGGYGPFLGRQIELAAIRVEHFAASGSG